MIGGGDWMCGRVLAVCWVEQGRQRSNQIPPKQQLDRQVLIREVKTAQLN